LRRVIIIEDNRASARLMSRIVESRKNSEVYLAHNGAIGLEMVRTVKPDLVITDLMMPELDGFGVVEAIRADDDLKNIMIVVVTAKDLTAKERDFLEDRADMVLQKGSFITDDFMEQLLKRLN
ncbi:MAG: response regulator, partial [Anaerolineae bacterium]|nr:response regulator [Anaerolineae bacterium]